MQYKDPIHQWGMFEASFQAQIDGNPFIDAQLSATFAHGDKHITVPGFYDGDSVYRVRFMPDTPGHWHYRTASNVAELNDLAGEFNVIEAAPDDHGPVRVSEQFHFAYADGTTYRELGTTCYAWIHQSAALQEQTLKTLETAPFNKLRMCILPKWYPYNHTEPDLYPFEGAAPDQWDFTLLNPSFFQHLDRCILALKKRGIQADLILFHPYDEGHWGFDRKGADNDDRYLRYVIARYCAFSNVWWSLANEWDFVHGKSKEDWNRFGEIVNTDPFHHLTSIHHGFEMFDHSTPWITHLSVQGDWFGQIGKLREQYSKPVVYDECCYEGNIIHDWGNITAEKLVMHFWLAFVAGGYCGHGETYTNPDEILWWSKGGVLIGHSPERLHFFSKIMQDAPHNSDPISQGVYGIEGEYYLAYFGDRQPKSKVIPLPEGTRYRAEWIDTWNMTITPLEETFAASKITHNWYGEIVGVNIPLPEKQFMAVRLRRI